jgi:hypothetical protein
MHHASEEVVRVSIRSFMKIHLRVLAGSIAILGSAMPARAAAIILTAELDSAAGHLNLSWAGGKPSYQLQMRSALEGNWINVGEPTIAINATVQVTSQNMFFRIVQDYTALYQVVFDATWSSSTHPAAFPSGAHWSGLVGGVHNEQIHFWRDGETASAGIQFMAERGNQSTLLSEIRPAITNGVAHFTLAGGGIGSSPGSVSLTFPRAMRRDFPLVTLCSMIAPSPDWFVGVDSLSLIENDEWVSTKTVTLFGFDAGTDSGASYSSPDLVTAPRGVVTRFTGFPALVGGAIIPFGTFTFTRLD